MPPFVKDYLTPAPNADLIRKLLLAGRHLIILNKSGPSSMPKRSFKYANFRSNKGQKRGE